MDVNVGEELQICVDVLLLRDRQDLSMCPKHTETHTTASAQLLPSLPSVGISQALLTRCQANFKITPISILCLFTTPSTHTHVLIPHSLSLSLKHHCFAVRGEKAKTSSLSRMHIHIWFSSPTLAAVIKSHTLDSLGRADWCSSEATLAEDDGNMCISKFVSAFACAAALVILQCLLIKAEHVAGG